MNVSPTPDSARSPGGAASTLRLSMETRLSLRELSNLLGEQGHAVIWASNYEARNDELPTSSQIVHGLERDLGVKISLKSAERGLKRLRQKLILLTITS